MRLYQTFSANLVGMLHRALLTLSLLAVQAIAGDSAWTSNGPYGGYIQSFTFHPTNQNLIFASEFEGLFRSSDRGLTWHRLAIPGGEFIVRIHPKAPEIIIASNYADGIFQSKDNGESWEQIFHYPFEEDSFYDMEFDPTSASIIYSISYYHGVFKSTDGGRNWSEKNTGLSMKPVAPCCVDTPQLEIDPKTPGTIYVLMPSRQIYKSMDGAESWRLASAGLKLTAPAHTLVVNPGNTRILYAGGTNGIFRSTDGGFKWSSRDCKCSVRSLSLDPRTPDIIFGAGEKAVKTKDRGESWNWFTPHPFVASIFLSVAVDPFHPELVLVGGFGSGISRSQNGGNSWSTQNEQIDALNVVRLVAHPKYSGRLLALAGQQVYLTGDRGQKWDLPLRSRSSAFYFSDITIHPLNPNLIVAVGSQTDKPGAVVISTDGGNHWEAGHNFYGVNYGCGRCVTFDPQNQKTLYLLPFDKKKTNTTPLGVARTTDLGKTWKFLNNGLTSKDVWVIAVHPRNSSNLYAGTGTGNFFISEDGGQNWLDRTEGLDHASIRSVAIDPENPAMIYLATYDSIFKSGDSGKSWTRISAGLPDAWFNFIDVDGKHPEILYVAGQAGIFVSKDHGETWNTFDTKGLGKFAVWNFLVDPIHPDIFYAGTDRGVFSYKAVGMPK